MHSHMLLRICKILWSSTNVLTMVNIIPHMVDNVCTVCTYGKRWHDESDEGWDVVGAVLWLIWLEASASNSACHQPVRLPTPTSPCPGGYSEIAFVLIPMKNPENLKKSTRMLCFTMQNQYFSWFSGFFTEIRKTRALAGLSRLDGLKTRKTRKIWKKQQNDVFFNAKSIFFLISLVFWRPKNQEN